MKDVRTGVIYLIDNDVNDKIYIGRTYSTIEHRFNQHKNAKTFDKFHIALRDIGPEHFRIRELGRFDDSTIGLAEKRFIAIYNSIEDGYNTDPGGGNSLRIELAEDEVLHVLRLYKIGFGQRRIEKQTGLSNYKIRYILDTYGQHLKRNQSFSKTTEEREAEVFGVHKQSGHLVSFRNEYVAALEIEKAGLSVQKPYYIKNDIIRSTKTQGYGVAGYVWFYDKEEAHKLAGERSKGFDNNRLIKIKDSVLTKVKSIEQMEKEYSKLRAASRVPVAIDTNRFSPLDTSRETYKQLLLLYSVNMISEHYGISFPSMRKRLYKAGLPYTKEMIREYRLKHQEKD